MKIGDCFRRTKRKNPRNVVSDSVSGTLGWKTNIGKERNYFNLKIHKIIAKGIGLRKNSIVYCYLCRDKNNRPMFVAYLDGKSRRIRT